MINIEGTPHEKALLVISSYIIGFISAYIAFVYAFPMHDRVSTITYIPTPPAQTAAVIDSQNQSVTPKDPATLTELIDVVYENQGLYLYGVSEVPLLLSKHADAVNVTHTDDMTIQEKQGMHSNLPAFEYWTNHDMVYFCENYEDEDMCVPYLYDITESLLYVVQNSAGPIEVSNQEAKAVKLTSPGKLEIGEYASVVSQNPWVVAAR